jgi:hypothetical protein
MKGKNFLLTLLVVALITVLVISLIIANSKTFLLGRAANQQYSLANSYVFASPLSAKAVSEKIRVTVFLLDDRGRGVVGKRIIVSSSPAGLNFADVQPTSDNLGQAVFDVTSANPGQYVLTATVEGQAFPQTITVRFQ